MIYLEMAGRLGNQMFRYAFARRIQQLTGEELYIDFKRVYEKGCKQEGWTNSLKLFNTKEYIEVCDRKDIFYKNSSVIQKIIYFGYKIGNKLLKKNKKILCKYQKLMQPILNRYNLYFIELGYYNYNFKHLKNNKLKYICGCFECEKYFIDIKEDIIKEFTPKKRENKENENLYKIIEKTNSVCISIRRGDFVSNEKNSKVYNICDLKYYNKAIEIMKKKLSNPTFIIFSDDIEWAKNNIKIENAKIYFETGKDSVDEKLRLMYSCKHFIISNSTFSWWAQFLSRNDKKIVISPNKWYKTDIVSDLISKDWIKVDVDE